CEICLEALARSFGLALLLGRIGVDRRAVLRADIVALAHALGRVVAFPEHLQEAVIADDLGVVDDEYDLGMPGLAAAHLFIGRVRGGAAGIADRRGPHARRLPELALGAPEAAEPKDGLLQAAGIGAFKLV